MAEIFTSKLSYSEIKREGKTIVCYIMDAGDFEHWESQIDRDYSELSEKEKESDRKEAREYLPLLEKVRKETAEAVADKMTGTTLEERSDFFSFSINKLEKRFFVEGYNQKLKEEKEIKKQIIESL